METKMTSNAFDRDTVRLDNGATLIDPGSLERRARALQAQFLREAAASGLRAVFRGLGALGRRARGYVERHQALAHLHQLDDRLLADIGLSRGNLLSELLRAESVREPSRREAASVTETSAEIIRPAANVNRPARAA